MSVVVISLPYAIVFDPSIIVRIMAEINAFFDRKGSDPSMLVFCPENPELLLRFLVHWFRYGNPRCCRLMQRLMRFDFLPQHAHGKIENVQFA